MQKFLKPYLMYQAVQFLAAKKYVKCSSLCITSLTLAFKEGFSLKTPLKENRNFEGIIRTKSCYTLHISLCTWQMPHTNLNFHFHFSFSGIVIIPGHFLHHICNLFIIPFYCIMKTNANTLATDLGNDKMYNNTE